MSVCALTIPADTEQVRVARLVVTAAARRIGMDSEAVDDVRLAVGEAVGRAVLRHQRAATDEPVTVRILDEPTRFAVEVLDHVGGVEDEDAGLAMAVITGVAPEAESVPRPDGGQTLRMAWVRPPAPDL